MIQQVQFALRQKLWGRWALRRGLPTPPRPSGGVRECDYYRLLLTALMPPSERAAARQVVDIGCRNWAYAQAVADAFPHAALCGVEADGGRRHWNLYRRVDYARAHARATGRDAAVVEGDARDACLPAPPEAGRRVFLLLFPFVSDPPCRAWGLPARFADYASLLRATCQGADAPRDRWLCAHQGAWEAERARPVYRAAGLRMRERPLQPRLWAGVWPSPHATWVFSGSLDR